MSSTGPLVVTRPAGVTASAVVAVIGSALTLLAAGLMLIATLQTPPASEVPRAFVFGVIAGLAALGALGITTGVGVLRLRRWARVSMLVFAGITAVFSLISILVMLVVPLPSQPGVSPLTIRGVVIAFYTLPVVIGVWWLVQFNRPSAKAAFANGAQAAPSLRPLSVSIIAWWMLVGGVSTFIPALIAMPTFLFGVIMTGWSARLVYAVFAAVGTYLGWGLLKLDERARRVAIGWLGFSAAHTLHAMLFARDKLRELQGMFESSGAPPTAPLPDMMSFTLGIMTTAVVLMSVAILFLVREKGAFQRDVGQV